MTSQLFPLSKTRFEKICHLFLKRPKSKIKGGTFVVLLFTVLTIHSFDYSLFWPFTVLTIHISDDSYGNFVEPNLKPIIIKLDLRFTVLLFNFIKF